MAQEKASDRKQNSSNKNQQSILDSSKSKKSIEIRPKVIVSKSDDQVKVRIQLEH